MGRKLIQLAERVWLWRHDPNPKAVQSSVGVIIGESESVLVDAGNSPALARGIRDELAQSGLPAVGQIIYTHHHWDHTYGACEFHVPVLSHSTCKAILTEEAQKPWGQDYLLQEISRSRLLKASYGARMRAIRDWATFRIVVPDVVFESCMTIVLGQIDVLLQHVGGQHSEDSIVVRVPSAGVMFLGDCYYPPPLHLRTPQSQPSLDMLAALESKEYSLYVEGHDRPMTRQRLLGMLERRSHTKA